MKNWKDWKKMYFIPIQGFGSSKSHKGKNNAKQYGYLKFVGIQYQFNWYSITKKINKKNHQNNKLLSNSVVYLWCMFICLFIYVFGSSCLNT